MMNLHNFVAACLAMSFTLGAAGAAKADEPRPEPYGDDFNGSFVEFSVRGAPTTISDGAWAVDTGIRQAFPFLLGDTRLSYRYDRAVAPGFDRLETHEMALHGAIHPLYLLILGSDWISYVASSIYLELGVGGHLAVATSGESNESDLGFTWSVGGGIDIPLADPDMGWAPWVNVLYRYRAASFDGSAQEVELGGHAVFIGLGMRRNGLLF